MTSLKSQLGSIFSQAFINLGYDGEAGVVTLSDRPDLAHFQCNGALSIAKLAKKPPRIIATQIVDHAEKIAEETFGTSALTLTIAGPGFINIIVNPELLGKLINTQSADPRLGCQKTKNPHLVVVDYGGPNVAKPMHVGHLRSPIIGDAIVRLHRFLGNTVIGDNHLGDWGTQMGMLIAALKEKTPDAPYFSENFQGEYPSSPPVSLSDLEEMYPRASKRYQEDDAFKGLVLRATNELQQGRVGYRKLWEHFVQLTVDDLKSDFNYLGVTFDLWLGESFYENLMPSMVAELKKGGFTQESDGALVIPLDASENEPMPPLMLVKSGGGFLYHTSDLATILYRVRTLKAQEILYVVDSRQSLHFSQVFSGAKKTRIAEGVPLKHLAFGTMNGPDGKPFKTRSGGVIKLKELFSLITTEARKRIDALGENRFPEPLIKENIIKQVGVATLKYADLKHRRTADYIFDIEKFSNFEGNTGPYLQYASVRMKSLLKKAADIGATPGEIIAPENDVQINLILELLKLADIVQTAFEENEPHHLCDYGFKLAQNFNSFYTECHMLKETNRERQRSWLALTQLCYRHMELILSLLGIDIPEFM